MDLLTDLDISATDIRVQKVEMEHTFKARHGMTEAALHMVELLVEPIKQFLMRNHKYTVLITGHSFGEGVAALVTLMWIHVLLKLNSQEFSRLGGPNLRCLSARFCH